MAHIGEENRLGAGDDLAIDIQRAADLRELERRPHEMVQAGGNKEFFKEAVDKHSRNAGILHKPGQGANAVGHKRPNPGKSNGVADNDRRHGDQRQLRPAIHR